MKNKEVPFVVDTSYIDPSSHTLSKGAKTKAQAQESCLMLCQDDLLCVQIKTLFRAFPNQLIIVDSPVAALKCLEKDSFLLLLQDLQDVDEASAFFQKAFQLRPEAICILLTDSDHTNEAMQLLHKGLAAHSISKPLSEERFLHCIQEVLKRSALLEENRELIQELTQQQQQMEKERKMRMQKNAIDTQIQQILHASSTPTTQVSGLCIEMSCNPSSFMEGDFFDFYQKHPSYCDVVIGDVMGRGLSAALVALVVKTQVTRFAIPTQRVQLCNEEGIWQDDLLTPDELIRLVYREINSLVTQLQQFVRLLYGRFDFQKRVFSYVNCGFAKPLYFQKKTGQVHELSAQHASLGISQQETYDLSRLDFSDEDFFLFYSDSVVKPSAENGEPFGIERLKAFLQAHHALALDQLKEQLEKEILSLHADSLDQGPLTLILMKVQESNFKAIRHPEMARFCSDVEQAQLVRHFIQRVFTQVPGDAEAFIHAMQLCINEAFCNLAVHAYGDKKSQEIRISCECLKEGAVVELTDQGCEFDPALVAHPNFSGSTEHGFGWYIIRELADQVIYVRKNSPHGWNHLRIFKKYILHEVSMDMSYKKEGGVLVVTFDGDHLDAKNSGQCKEYVLGKIRQEQIYNLVFDLHLLKFIDSSGLGSFLALLKELHTHQGELKLAEMGKTVRTVFELVCMHKIFDIYPTVDAAIRACQDNVMRKSQEQPIK